MNFGNEKRRDTWFSIIKEVMTAYWFIGDYGPKESDPLLSYMDGSKPGRKRAIISAANSIARLQVHSHHVLYLISRGPLCSCSATSSDLYHAWAAKTC